MKLAFVYLLAGLLAYFLLPEAYLYTIGFAMLFAALSASWDLTVGYTGQVNLGHTTFVGLGAYTFAVLLAGRLGFELNVYAAFLTAILVSAFVGATFGAIALRLKGYYFALITAILPLVFMQTVFIFSEVFGGEEGFSIGLERGVAPELRYIFALVISFAVLSILLLVVRSRFGVRFMAIRDNEELAEAIGIDTTKYKVLSFTLSSAIAGFVGAAIVLYRITVSPDLYSVDLMLMIILASVVGGIGTIYGPFFFGLLIYLLKVFVVRELLISFGLRMSDEIVLYAILIVAAILMPNGIAAMFKRHIKRIE